MYSHQTILKRLSIMLLSAFVLAALAACPSKTPPKTPEQQAEKHYQKGLKYWEADKFEEALTEWESATKIYPQHKNARLKLVVTYTKIGAILKKKKEMQTANKAFEMALRHLRELSRLIPNNAGVFYLFGLVYSSMGDIDKSIEAYRQAILLKPTEADYHFSIAGAYTKKGLFRPAIEHYEDAVRLDRNKIDAYFLLGVLCEKKGDVNKAVRYYQEYVNRENRPSEAKYVEQAKRKIHRLRGGGAIY